MAYLGIDKLVCDIKFDDPHQKLLNKENLPFAGLLKL